MNFLTITPLMHAFSKYEAAGAYTLIKIDMGGFMKKTIAVALLCYTSAIAIADSYDTFAGMKF